MRVVIQVRATPAPPVVHGVVSALTAAVPSFHHDAAFASAAVPFASGLHGAPFSPHHPAVFHHGPPFETRLVRGTLPDGGGLMGALATLRARPEVVAVFSDPVIMPLSPTTSTSPAVGTIDRVAHRLAVATLQAQGLTGAGVPLAIVDTGIHHATLGPGARLDPAHGWTPPGVAVAPGQHPIGHGTYRAIDARVAAPEAELYDYAVFSRRDVPGDVLLSDAHAALTRLQMKFRATPADRRRLVISNSWSLHLPSDFPPGTSANYSDNAQHPFNLLLASLEADGADILFSAGNCGRGDPGGACPDVENTICGANALPCVLTVAGVDLNDRRAEYSSQGPGRLSEQKPDLVGYTHFDGPLGLHDGTSTACPLVAGVVAAVRTRYSAQRLKPARLRTMLQKSARDLGATGFDYDHGWGVVDPAALLAKLAQL